MKFKTLILILVSATILFGGKRNEKSSSFLSFYVGDLSILSEKFTDFYDSKNELIFGLGFGVPIINSLSVDASITYYNKKSDFFQDSLTSIINNARLKQLIFNAGLQVHLLPNRIIGLSFLLGVNYSLVEEEKVSPEKEILYEFDGEGNFGMYVGANFDINLGRGPVALFGDVKYTYSWSPVIMFDDEYSEIRYTGGLKIYLTDRW